MKKRLLSAIALMVVLTLSLFMAACGDDVSFKVSAEFDSDKGVVTVSDSDGKAKTEFNAGAQVVVVVTAKEGYEVDSFKVNGVETELNNGVYAFYARANTVVKATFKATDGESEGPAIGPDEEKTPDELFAEAFDSVQTTFKASGTYMQAIEGGSNVINYVTTVFGDKAIQIIETDGKTNEVLVNDIYVDVNGKIAQPYRTLNNEISYNTSTEDFAEYGNPFKLLTTDDFTATEQSGTYALAGDKTKAAATAITGYIENISAFTVSIEDGKVKRINITTARIQISGYSYTATYMFILSEWGTAEVDAQRIEPYETEPEHTALKSALKAASEAKNYTIKVSEIALSELDADIEYNVYVTETAIFYDCVDYEEGYVQTGEGAATVVYPFDYDPETEIVRLHDAVRGFPTIYSMRASFNGFAPEVFELDEDGAYVLRDDCLTVTNVRDVLINFGEGVDQIMLYARYTFSVKFVLKDDLLYQVELYYSVSDAFIKRTLTYMEWDATTMPISFDNCERLSVLDDYVGTYTDGTNTAVIDKNGIVINDEAFTITGYDIQYDTFTGNWDGGVWYMTKQGEKQLILYNNDEDITYTLTSTSIDPVDIPDEFNGVWSKNGKTVAIAYDMVEYDGKMLTVLSYDETNGALYATDGELTYRMFAEQTSDGAKVLLLIVYVDGMSTAYYDLNEVADAVIVPKALLGTFEKEYISTNEYYKATISLASVRLVIGRDNPEVTIVSAAKVSNMWKLTLDVEGEEYFIMENGYSANKIDLGATESRLSVTLDRVVEQEPPVSGGAAVFYGTFTGTDDEDGKEYVVTIDANSVTIIIDDDDTIVITDYEYDDGEIIFTIDNVMHGISSYDETDEAVNNIYLWSYDSLFVNLERSES